MPPTYEVHMFCDCGETHRTPFGMKGTTDYGGDPNRLGDRHAGVRVPNGMTRLKNVGVNCPRTGKFTTLNDHDEVFLVRTANEP